MNETTVSTNASTGLKFGLIAGLVYCISLFTRYSFLPANPITLGAVAFIFFCGIIGIFVWCALTRRKELGGYLELKDAFQTLFIAVLIAEAIYTIFNLVYLTYIDPGYMDRLQAATINLIEESGLDDDRKEKQLEQLEKSFARQKERLSVTGVFLSYLIGVAITGIFALIVALIVRKRKPVFDQPS